MSLTAKKPAINIHLLSSAIIVLAAIGIYWNSLQGSFIWDDRGLIIGSANYLSDWKNLFAAFTKPFFGDTPYYRPLLTGSFIADYQLWGANPFGFHYTNLIVHAVNALLVYLFIFLLFKEVAVALSASLLFTVHPVQSEAVAWISGRNDVLLTCFALISIILHLRWHHLKGIRAMLAYSWYLFAYACALLTKESAVVLPVLIMLIDYFFTDRGKSRAKDYFGLLLVTVLYFIAKGSFIGEIGLALCKRDFVHTLYGVIGSYAYYFKILLFPLFQSAAPTINTSSFSISSFALVLCLSALAVLCCKRFKELSFAILWVIVSLLPVCGIVPLSIPAQEHRLYLGTVCFSMLLPMGVSRLWYLQTQTDWLKKAKTVVLFMVPVFIALYSVKTAARNCVWQNELSFWIQTVHDAPCSAVARNNLGIAYASQGIHEKAIREFKQALALYDREDIITAGCDTRRYAKIYNNIGRSYYQWLKTHLSGSADVPLQSPSEEAHPGHDEEAAGRLYTLSHIYYRKSLQTDPASSEVYKNLGDLYYLKKNYQAAEKEYRIALKIDPSNAEHYNNLGLIFYALKNYDGAEKEFTKAMALRPDFAEARNNLALVYMHRGLYDKALDELKRVLALIPDNAGVRFNLVLAGKQGEL